jgi:hypothetical protein
MRLLLSALLVFTFLTNTAQRYSTTIKDSAITNFMYWLIKNDTTFKAIKHIDKDILKLDTDNFIYADSFVLKNRQLPNNIFAPHNKLTRYFNQADAVYFVSQIKQQRKYKWQLKMNGIRLLDTIELVNNQVDKVLFSYSLPLFSSDNKYVIIIEAFFCGLICGGGEYNLYERQPDNSWKRIQQFNQWAE